MAEVFKDTEAREIYKVFKAEYLKMVVLIESLEGGPTRLLDRVWETLEQQYWDEILGCLKEGWIESVQEEIDNAEWAGSLEGIFEVIEKHDGWGLPSTKN